MPYRDDLEAARIRITELEAQLWDAKRGMASRHEKAMRRPWGWLGVGAAATLVLVGAGVGPVLLVQAGEPPRGAAEAARELHEARAEAHEAREERRVAYEMMEHAYDQLGQRGREVQDAPPDPQAAALETEVLEPRTEPVSGDDGGERRPATTLFVASDRAARVAVDGNSLYEWMPARLALAPGQHAISVIADDGRVRRETVRIRDGQISRVVVRFDP